MSLERNPSITFSKDECLMELHSRLLKSASNIQFVPTILKVCSKVLHSFCLSDDMNIGTVIKDQPCHFAHSECDAGTLIAVCVAVVFRFFEHGLGRFMLSDNVRCLPSGPSGSECCLQKNILFVRKQVQIGAIT